MKTFKLTILAAVCAAGLLWRAAAQDAQPAATEATAAPPPTQATPAETPAPVAVVPTPPAPSLADLMQMMKAQQEQIQALQRQLLERQVSPDQIIPPTGREQPIRGARDIGGRSGRGGPGRGGRPTAVPEVEANSMFSALTNSISGEDTNATIKLNFKDAALDQVLTYLSEAAGFVIVLETPVRGNVSMWSEKPVTRADAVDALNAALKKNNYGVLASGNLLTVYSIYSKNMADIRTVQIGTNPVPMSAEIVTAIIPVRYISASEVMQNIYQLRILPDSASMTANNSGNSLVLTDSMATVHRVVGLVRALDNPLASGTSFEVIQLQYADAKTLSTIIQSLYQNQGRGAGGGAGGFNPFQQLLQGGFGGRGGGGFGGFGGGGFGGGGFGGGGGGGGGRRGGG